MSAIALVPARDEADRVGDTVRALRSIGMDGLEVVVVDGGSRDDTVREAVGAGARVLRAPLAVGKGDAVEAALWRLSPADHYLFADADLGSSASALGALLDGVLGGRADMAVAVLPAPPTGGFGLVKRAAGSAIDRLAGFSPREPLSGQRAMTAACLRACRPLASGFGLEIGLTIDAVRVGMRVVEIPVPSLEHRYTRKDLAGFRHRGRQGWDALRAVVSRSLALR
jgi:glycosyltransferase involved in cell wall biosynthesis